MSKILDRAFEAISANQILNGQKLELRIHGQVAQGDRLTHLSIPEARILAYGLLAEAERIEAALEQ